MGAGACEGGKGSGKGGCTIIFMSLISMHMWNNPSDS